jgi:hypothetical protein
LPTEDPAEFEKFKKEIFDDYKPVGRSEENIVKEIARWEWRLDHLDTYDVAMRARERHKAIFSKLAPSFPSFLTDFEESEPLSPEEREALRKAWRKRLEPN